MAKHIFVTGGVVSSLGKGLTCASIGMLLERRGIRVRLQKFDPYINVDPGTMSPYQHGEVYVLDDGTETDLDLGHYERFTNAPLTKDCNFTTGKIYLSVIEKERRGDYRGRTVQVIPHVTNEIKQAILKLATPDVDVVITEIGGTVGDIEGAPFLEAIRQFALDVGKHNCMYIHLTLVPYLKAARESKTKPTQHSVGELRKIGIQPDVLICRTERELAPGDAEKIAQFCNVEYRAVIEERDKEFSIYEVPLSLVNNKLDELVVEKFHLDAKPLVIDDWKDMLERIRKPAHDVTIAVVGKYVRHHDAYKSIYESLDHAGIDRHCRVRIVKIEAETIEREGAEKALSNVDGVLVPGGFDERGIPGKIAAIRHAREHGIPFFGICLGLQCAVVEFARHVAQLDGANSTEFDKNTPHPVVAMLDEQRNVTMLGGTMRLGAYECVLTPGSRAHTAFGQDRISERHRHRYEVNNAYRERLIAAGMAITGTSPDGKLVEVIEVPNHPWFVAVQSHPEFKSKPTAAHPLFRDFIAAAIIHSESGKRSETPRSRTAVSAS
ncbi:CTP synthase [Tuwongella immobilis]|uniref:CTP synthase n=1 Tax=Tuwongella immobilis TaxID=692036 RepID=A0A6C2YJN9_9BACT|nr:CTP synthase [Tuwongella immobilis]VIP01788.1 ctp synthase : CTP synthase OS=Pirellula staleyi (strain ATCC 27377 / DSM 6068 / ICPB 4128) GN=pyrG PE=3 SV=1: CTP_synth_N: GATase [Tuwongella immobilis]VTR99451.1 ctp synthase : CTP synthase OS=Pirellula staleyi (strain ATCC 27377 / DSM 6068 / ICPB 4128) GN=pyrG PE=3 SV=1: CTP_synth_N: GATase [Tuwongella immobilis]